MGDTVVLSNVPYAVTFIDQFLHMCYLVQKECSMVCFRTLPISDLIKEVEKDGIIIPHISNGFCPDPDNEQYKKHLAIINAINKAYAPTYLGLGDKKSKPVIDELVSELNMSRSTIWRNIRGYLQSGCDPTATYPKPHKSTYNPDQKRRGRHNPDNSNNPQCEVIITPDVEAIFEEYKNKLLHNRELSIPAAYNKMVKKYFNREEYTTDANGQIHYTKKRLPESEIPTLRQFKYWFYTNTTYKRRTKAKTSPEEWRNNHRALVSDTVSGAIGPGYMFELDHCEFPVSLISVFSNDTVSYPVVSIAIDVSTKAVTAVGIAFNNNSNIAYTNLMFNLAEDKVEYCKQFGIELEDASLWPSCVFPRIIRVDNGSDFISNNTVRFCNENGIELDPVPPAMGSLKPNVERFFLTMKQHIKAEIAKHGLITKRKDSEHHTKAVLNINEFRRIVIKFILTYNQMILQNYTPPQEMLDAKVDLSPVGLWKYGCTINPPRPIIHKEDYYWSLLIPDNNAYLHIDGVHFKDLRYISNDEKIIAAMEKAGRKHIPFPVRFDPRDLSVIFYVDENGLKKELSMNTNHAKEKSLWGCSLWQIEKYNEELKKLKDNGVRRNSDLLGDFSESTARTVKAAASRYGMPPGIDHMKENRQAEKDYAARVYSPSEKLRSMDLNSSDDESSFPLPEPEGHPELSASVPLKEGMSEEDEMLAFIYKMNQDNHL